MNLPDPSPLLDLIEAFRRSKAMFTAVSMGVFDRLQEAPSSAADLAASLGADPARWRACWTPAPPSAW